MGWKNHINNHFANCTLLAKAHDNCRNRDVSLYHVAGEWLHVGVSDGTDAWIAPVSSDPFSVSVRDLLGKLRDGTLKVVDYTQTPTRKKLNVRPAQTAQDTPNDSSTSASSSGRPRLRLRPGVVTGV